MRFCWVLSVLLFPALPLPAQQPSVITSVGYSSPRPIAVAPGQVITLFVHTTQTSLNAPALADLSQPLPSSLAGLSVGLKQTFATLEQAVPLISAAPVTRCTAVNPVVCSSFIALTVQIPFELQPSLEDPRLPASFAALVVYENGVAGDPLQLNPVLARLHVVTTCDSTDVNVNPPCVPLVLHADGSTVTLQNPAKPDELLTARVFGAGRADSSVATGAKPSSTVSLTGMKLYAAFGNDLQPGISASEVPVEGAALSANSVGLYTVSFRAPQLPAGTPDCAARGVSDAYNVTITLTRGASIEGVGLCVAK
jgi:uncharacterized protein (TIGR03437 family)